MGRREAKEIIERFHGLMVRRHPDGRYIMRRRAGAGGGVEFQVTGPKECLMVASSDERVQMSGLAIDQRPLAYPIAWFYVNA